MIGDGETLTAFQEEWFEILFEKYQIEYGAHQHDQHDSDLILSIFQENSLKLINSQSEGEEIDNINGKSTTNSITNSTEISDEKSEGNLSSQSSSSSSSLTTSLPLTISKKILRKCRPQLNLFCSYYACCLLGEIDCTEREWSALMKVIILFLLLI